MIAVRRRAAAPIVIAAGALILSACSGSGTTTATMTGGTSSSPAEGTSASSTQGTSASSIGTTSSSESSRTTSRRSDPTAAITRGDAQATITAPGTKLKVGEAATLVAESGKKSDTYYTKAIYKVTVTDIRQGSNADFASFSNKDKFVGVTPWYIESTNEIVYWEGSPYGSPNITLSAILADGRKAGWVSAFGDFDKCKSTTIKDREVGATFKPCTIAATKGEAVTGVRYEGDSSSDYYKTPVIWQK